LQTVQSVRLKNGCWNGFAFVWLIRVYVTEPAGKNTPNRILLELARFLQLFLVFCENSWLVL